MRTATQSLFAPIAVTALVLLGSAVSHAQTNRTRPVQVIVPFAGASASDVVTRILLERTSKALAQPVVIDNRPGAGGNTRTPAAARSSPDGYTLVGSGSGPIAANRTLYRDLGYDPEKDFEPVAIIGVFPIVVVASTKLPVNTLKELIAYAKERPNELNYGSVGIGSSQHLAGAYFDQVTGVKLTHVPYRNIAQYTPDLIAGSVPLGFQWLPNVLAALNSGGAKALAVASKKRMAACPTCLPPPRPGFPTTWPPAGSCCWHRKEPPSRLSPSSATTHRQRCPMRRCGRNSPSRARSRSFSRRRRSASSYPPRPSSGVTSSPRRESNRSNDVARRLLSRRSCETRV